MGDTHDTNWEAKVWGFVDLREGFCWFYGNC